MTITVLDIAADGTQNLRKQEVPSDYFNSTAETAPVPAAPSLPKKPDPVAVLAETVASLMYQMDVEKLGGNTK